MLPSTTNHLDYQHHIASSSDHTAEKEFISGWDELQPRTPSPKPVLPPARPSTHTARKLALVGLLAAQSIGTIGFFGSVYISLHPYMSSRMANTDYQAMLGYLVIFVIATVFSVYIAVDSLLSKNTPQLIALCIFEAAMCAFAGILPHQIAGAIENQVPYDVARWAEWRLVAVPGIIGASTLALAWLTWYFYKEFGWQTYKKLGADIRLKKAMRTKSVFYMLQKFSFFFLVGVCVIIVQMRKESDGDLSLIDIILPASALVVSCLIIIFATVAVELEVPLFVALYGIAWGCSVLFLCYEAIKLHPLSKVTNVQHTMILLTSITILLLLATGVMAGICCRNFGKGLKEARNSNSLWSCKGLTTQTNERDQPSKPEKSQDARAILD